MSNTTREPEALRLIGNTGVIGVRMVSELNKRGLEVVPTGRKWVQP